ncbi:MAG: outer membrane homotrimeric porin [Desulfovibrionaceae bacterium]|nr:outer membrane homotrimeric porin [Desulfovibrionaceae bacterium]
MTLFNRLKRNCMVLLLAAGMLAGGVSAAHAIDFKAQGEWIVSFGLGDANFNDTSRTQKDDMFSAAQRIRLQLDAVASESLSGTVFFEIGQQDWGNNTDSVGGALGADGVIVKVKNAYIDWLVPETDLRVRMGLQALALPNAAGGSAIMDGDVAAVTMNYKFTDNASLTAFWMRPANDNYQGQNARDSRVHYLDNIDFFGLTVPLSFDGFEITPWAMYGMIGRNALDDTNGWNQNFNASDGDMLNTLYAYLPGQGGFYRGFRKRDRAYADAWFFGLPIAVTALDPINIEFDVNYGYVSGLGSVNAINYKNWARFGQNASVVRADTKREGWLIKALVEYKMDWGVPGLFGWYSSGDDGDIKNGSERMPSISGSGNFTSFMGSAGTDFWADGTRGLFWENNMTYAGTWGVGLQIRDMTFLEDLSHTFRIAYWGGTNSTDMVKYSGYSGAGSEVTFDGPYLTTNDGLLEFNLDNVYQVYENLAVNLDLGYIVNMMDRGTWARSWTKRGYADGEHFSSQDAWKAQVSFVYSF